MSYTILSVAYPFTSVGANASGGSEQVLNTLDRELTLQGHRSLVLAVEGSEVHGELIASPACKTELNESARRWGQKAHRRLLLETLARNEVDLVHMHALDFHAYLPPAGVPVLATLHLPIDWYPKHIFHEKRKNCYLNCVSASQQLSCPPSDVVVPHVPNGIDVRSFEYESAKQGYLLGLGRICPEKGFHLALDAAKAAGVPMTLAGELFPYADHLAYFDREIAPRLDETRRYIGPVGSLQKRQLLSSAAALLVPSLVAETSSLVTMEALASGTPVIALRRGAIPELVVDGKTGFLVTNVKEMTRAIMRVSTLSPQECRASVKDKCSLQAMYDHYLSLYSKILQGAETTASVARDYPRLSWLTPEFSTRLTAASESGKS